MSCQSLGRVQRYAGTCVSTCHGYSLECIIPVGYAWLLENIYIRHRVVGYRLLADMYEQHLALELSV